MCSRSEASLQRKRPGLNRSLQTARSCSRTRRRGCLTAGEGTTAANTCRHTHTHRSMQDTEQAQGCSTHDARLHGNIQGCSLTHASRVQATVAIPVQELVQGHHLSMTSGLKTHTHTHTHRNILYVMCSSGVLFYLNIMPNSL